LVKKVPREYHQPCQRHTSNNVNDSEIGQNRQMEPTNRARNSANVHRLAVYQPIQPYLLDSTILLRRVIFSLCEIDSVEFQSNTKLSSEWIRCQHKMPSWILRSRHLIGWFECQNHEVCSRMQLGWRHLNCPCVRINCQTVDGTV
jgi:hypothetical protein